MSEKKITKYTPGFNIHDIQKKYNIKNVIKLASNENPFISDKVSKFIANKNHKLNLYPDSMPDDLLKLISKNIGYKTTSNNIILGNGSNEILEFIARAYLDSSSEVIIPKHSFLVYEIICKLQNCKIVTSHTDKDKKSSNYMGIDLDAISKKITKKTKLIFLANPANPTGTYLKLSIIDEFLQSISSKIIVVVDEAYYEYLNSKTNRSAVSLLSKYKNLFVTRSFSKIYGLASLRVGYGISNQDNIKMLRLYRQPFNTNMFAQKSASIALSDMEFIQRSKSNNDKSLTQFIKVFEKLSIEYLGKNCNFITFKVGRKSNALFTYLLQNGIIVRPLVNYKLPEYLRVSLGKSSDNNKFLKHLKLFYSEKI